jgi:regulator of protease activity HflC (stomatin/prohibitin superfamily)
MVALIFLSIFALVSIGLFVAGFFAPGQKVNDRGVKQYSDGSPKLALNVVGTIVAAVFVAIYLFNAVFIVEPRTVGIVTEFGKATGTVDSGPHILAPWAKVTEFPVSNQTLDLDATDGSPEVVQAKFDGGGTGFVNNNINWHPENNDKAVALWNQWRDFDKVTNQVVKPRAQAVAAEVVGKYGPKEAVRSENYGKIAEEIKNKLQAELNSSGIKVEDVNVKRIDLDGKAQDNLNRAVVADGNIDIAKKEQERARIDNETANLKAQSAALSAAGLADRCLAITNAWDVNKNGPLPANWNCTFSNGLPLTLSVGPQNR